MRQKEIIDRLSKTVGGKSKKEIGEVLSAYHLLMREILEKEGFLRIKDFGSFKVVERNARACRNPQTGEMLEVPAKKVVKFKPSCIMLRILNRGEN